MKPTPRTSAQFENTPERPTLGEILGIMDTGIKRLGKGRVRREERDTLESA